MKNKIKTIEEIEKISKRLKKENKIVITTNGSFDIIHSAHINILEQAKKEGDVLIVLINSDESVKRFKGNDRPIIPQDERARMLEALQDVDYVVIFNEDTPINLIKKIKPNKHVKGGTFIPARIAAEKATLADWGGEFVHFELEEGYSTTNIIDKILSQK